METTPVDPALRARPLAPGPSTADSEAGEEAFADGRAESLARSDVEAALDGTPERYEFFQAMRLLRQRIPGRHPVGGYGDPADEVVRLGVDPTLAFPPSDIRSVRPVEDGPPRMAVAFMGLIGPNGVLPHRYTLQVADRSRARDHAMRDFLDIFHHRMLSLFHLAWEKHRFAVAYERDGRDHLSRHLLDLVGVGTGGLAEQLGLAPESLLLYAGLLAPGQRPAVALEQLLEDYFGVPVEVEQFVGGWYAIDRGAQCSLGDESGIAELGRGAVVGDEVWDQQARARIRIGPLSRAQYDDFLPTGSAHGPLRALVRFFTNDEVEVELQLVLRHDDVPPCVLGADADTGPTPSPPLGWCTWLRSATSSRDPDDTILSLAEARIPS